VFLFGEPSPSPESVNAQSGEAASVPVARSRHLKGAAGLPPPLIVETVVRPVETRPASDQGKDLRAASSPVDPDRRPGASQRAVVVTPALVLQAISERDSHPIAMINDQLVREGDKLGQVRVLKIGADAVEVLLENGQPDTVRFAPPPPPVPEPSPSPSPLSRP
jgi:hypothetical protein